MENAQGGPDRLRTSLSGVWHLLHRDADEVDVPSHRMDLRLDGDSEQLRAAVLNRNTGEEMLLFEQVSFDGEILLLQMVAQPGQSQTDMPFLMMRADGDTFRGRWEQQGAAMGPAMKLIRART